MGKEGPALSFPRKRESRLLTHDARRNTHDELQPPISPMDAER